MELLDKIQELWGRTLSPIENFTIINMVEEEHLREDVILEAAMLSVDKERPFLYMKKILYYVKNPLEKKKVDEPIEEPKKVRKCKWLEEFLENLEEENNQGGN